MKNDNMIEVYSWATPNGHKVHIMLEECGLPYRVHPIDIGAGDQFSPEFLAISPNNKIPAIVDPNGRTASRCRCSSRARSPVPCQQDRQADAGRYARQVRGDGVADVPDGRCRPDARTGHHFRIYAPEKIEYAINRYSNEAKRLYGVMDKRLGQHKYIAGASYSIADIAIFPWLRSWKNQGIDWVDFPNLKGWFDEIAARPAVQRGVDVLAGHRKPLVDDKSREMLFGATQYKKH
jgi:GST-like protein